MGFYQRYELLELQSDDGLKIFSGRDLESGKPVSVYLFPTPLSLEQQTLLGQASALPEPRRSKIFDQGNHEGTAYLVTAPDLGMPLRSFLTSEGAASGPPPPPDGDWRAGFEQVRRTFIIPDRSSSKQQSGGTTGGSDGMTRLYTGQNPVPKIADLAPAPQAKAAAPDYHPDSTQRLDRPEFGMASSVAAPAQSSAIAKPPSAPPPAPPTPPARDVPTAKLRVTPPAAAIEPAASSGATGTKLIPWIIGLTVLCVVLLLAIGTVLFLRR